MGRRFLLSAISCLLLLTNGLNAESSCKKGCTQTDNGILQYVPGLLYEYNFDSILTIGVSSGPNADDTTLKVTGLAKLFAEGNCGYTLQLGGVKVVATKARVEKKLTSTILKPVHFTMAGGKVEPELCTDANENEYSLNVKRAIVSMLQTTKNDEQEVDVFGLCPTHTSTSTVGNAEVITKIRNLNNCAYRESITNGLLAGVVNENAGIRSSMALHADFTKESKIVGGIVESVNAVEEYKYNSSPKGGSVLRAKVVSNLKVKNASGTKANAPVTGSTKSGIIFEKPDVPAAKNIGALKAAITQVIQLTADYVQADTASAFVDLIRLMRNADAETLLELAAVPHPNKVMGRKIYIDALVRTGTAESAKAIMKQLNKMDDKEKFISILSLRTVQDVDKDVLLQATTLLTPNAAKEIYLAIGNLVSKYCQRKNCEDSDIEPISKKFVESLKHCKPNTKKDEERIVYILKGIVNTHHLAKNVASNLAECAAGGRSNRVRVAALQAFSAASCQPALNKKALELLRNRNEDSELRIEAYLAVINCPTPETANEISEIVNAETVNQVGSFIKSNLAAIRDSTDSSKSNQRHFLGNIRVTKTFPKDVRRFSFNNELSYKLDALGLSASTDYKLIYSQHGFLPRSARLNVSTEIYGTNFNVFEAGFRQENFEKVLEYYVGPKGLLNKDIEDTIKIIDGRDARVRRSIADDANKISKKYKTYASKNVDDLNLDISLKVFGSEIMFLSLGDNIPSSLEEIIKEFSTIAESSKQQLSSFSKEFRMHSFVLDADVTYPTAIGIPFEVSAQVFAATKLDFAVNVDVDALLQQNWQNANFRLKVIPSVDVNANIKAGFNGLVLSTGIRSQTNLQSATGSDVKAAIINDGNGFNVDVELPREKIELVNVQMNADFYIAEQDKAVKSIELKETKKQPKQEACFNQLELIGFSVCVENDIGADRSATIEQILLAPQGLKVYILSERNFNIKGTYAPTAANGVQTWKLEYDTPGSKAPHATSLSFDLGVNPRTFGRISFDNPQFQIALEAGVSNDNKEMVLYGQLEQNGDIKKSKVGFSKKGNEYVPLIEVQDKQGVTNNINGYRADGKVVIQKTGDKSSKFTFDNFQLINKENERITLNGWVDVSPTALKTELRIAPGQDAFKVNGNFKIENNEYEVSLFVNDEKTPDNIIGGSAVVQLAQEKVNVQLAGKAFSWEVDTDTDVQYVKVDGSSAIKSSTFSNDFIVKHKNVQTLALKVSGATEDQNNFDFNAALYREKKVGSLGVKFNSRSKSQYDYVLEVNGKFKQHFIDLLSKLDFNGNHFVVDNALTTSWGTSITAKGDVGQRYTLKDVFVDLAGGVQINSKDKPSIWLLKVIGTPDKTTSEFRLSRENAELIKYTGESQHPQDKISAAKVLLTVKNLATAKADFKIAKNGKGEFTMAVDTLKTEPKHKIEVNSKFTVQIPKYDIETTVTLDAEHKLYFKTENVVDKNKLSTKNVAEIANKKVLFNANGSFKGEWKYNGEIQGAFDLTCPEGRVIDGNMKRKVTTNQKTGVAQGSIALQVNDNLPSGGKRTASLTGTLEKLNAKTKDISMNTQISYTDFEQKKLDAQVVLKHLPKGQNKLFEFAITVSGDIIPQTAELTVAIDEYNKQHAVARTLIKYGNDISLKLNGNYNLGERGTPATYTIDGNLQAPQTNFKSVDLHSNGKILRSATKGQDPIVFEVHFDEKFGTGDFIRFNTVYKGSQNLGSFNGDLETKQMGAPLKLGGTFTQTHTGDLREGTAAGKQKYSADFEYGNKFVKSTVDLDYTGSETAGLHFVIDSSFDAAKQVDVNVRAQQLTGETPAIIVKAKHDDKAYSMDTKVFRGSHKKGFNVNVGLPNAQPIVLVSEVELLGDRKAKLIVHIENLIDLDFKSTAEASYKSYDDFYVTAEWNSVKLNLDNYSLDVRSQGKLVNLNLKNANGVVFGGTATVALKKEQNKSIIEGQGQLQYNGKTQNSNFRLIRQTYDLGTDKEFGFSYTFNGNFGAKNGVSTLKITNRDFNVKLSVCEEKKQCTNVQLQSIVEKDEQDAALVQHSLLVLFDLRELGYPYEFEFQSKTIKEAFKFQYSLDSSIISNNNMKYQLVVSALPSNAKVQIKLPGREILLESKQQYPVQGKIFGHYENSVQFYIDKVNKPNDVMSLSATCDISGVEHSILNSKATLKLEHPAMRTLTVSGQFDANREKHTINAEAVFDIFRLPEQKITASSKLQNLQSHNGFNITLYEAINSKGLDLRYELNGHAALSTDSKELSTGFDVSCNAGTAANAFMFIGKDKLEVNANVLNEPIVQVLGEFNRQKNILKVDSKFKVMGQNSIDFFATVQPSMTKLIVKRGNSFTGNSELKLGKELTYSLEGYGKKIANGRIGLDAASFLNVNSNTDEAALNEYLGLFNDELSKEYAETREKLNARFQKLQTAVENQRQLLQEAIPDYTKVKDQYEASVNAIIHELESDPSFKQLADTYRQLYTKIVKITDEYSKVLISSYEDLQKSVSSIWKNVLSVLKETVIPAWEEFSVSATKVLEGLRTEVVNILREGVQTVVATLEKYGPTLKTYAKAIEETLKPYNEILQELTKFATNAFEEISNEIMEWLSKLPTFDSIQSDIKQKLEKLKFAEKSVELVNNIFDQLQILPTTPETSDLIQKLHDYLIAKLKQEPVNDELFLEELFTLFSKAIRSIIATIEFSFPKSASITGSEGIGGYLTSLPSSVEALTQIPSILSFRFSLFNYFLNENWDSIFSKEFLNSWVLFKNFELKGHLIEGRHVFTFDGEHLSFPGSCKYVLAQDSVDNNFTVIAQMNNGKLKSIVLTDSDNSFMEISDTGALKLNGAPVEYPQHTNGMHAWRNYYTLWMHSEYGVSVMCSTDLKLCHVSVNGFYTSKTRGLLGNGNAEPYDDLIQIDGTIASDAATFINGYGLGKCAPVTADQSPKTRTEICNEIFGIESPLGIGYLLEDPKAYRDACDQAVAAAAEKDKETAACTVATAYGSALKLDNVFVMLPPRCLKCIGAAGQRDLGQEFSVKIPTNKADLMFIVDLDVSSSVLHNLVAPVITEVRDALKTRGITDVQIAVVAYNESQRYPALLTSDNGKLNYNGNLGDVTLNGPKTFCLDCATQYLNDKRLVEVYEIVEKLVKTVVPQSDEHAYSMALKYPFRAAAAKSIIAVRSKSLDYDNLLKFVRAHVAGAVSQFDSALLHIIAPVKDLALDGVPAEKLIGFNSRLVATVDGKDNKKRPKLQFANNMGIDFVLNNGGWVFATQNFDSLKVQDQKKALNQVTNSIADSLFKTEIQADCTCLPIHGIHAQHKCSIKSSSFVPNKKIKSA